MEFVDNPLGMRNYFFDIIEQRIETFPHELKDEKAQLKLTLEALKDLILIDTGDIRFLKFFSEMSEFTINIALGNYKVRMPLGNPKNKDVFFSVATMLNQMAEELDAKCVPNNYLMAVLNGISKAAFICDEKKRIAYANDKFYIVSGLDPNDLRGKTLTDLIDITVGNTANGKKRDKLFLRRKNDSPVEILLRAHSVDPSHPLDRHGILYTFVIIG